MRGIVKKLEHELYGTVVTVQSPGSQDSVTFVVTKYDDPVELGDEIFWHVDRPPKNRESGSSGRVMALCPTCGNKRCPRANDGELACTGSNEPGQPGSAYPPPLPVLLQGLAL